MNQRGRREKWRPDMGSQAKPPSPQRHHQVTMKMRDTETQGLIESWAFIVSTHEMVLLLLLWSLKILHYHYR